MSQDRKIIDIAISYNEVPASHTAICVYGNEKFYGKNYDTRTTYNGNVMCSVHAEVDSLLKLLNLTKMRRYSDNKIRRKIKKIKCYVIRSVTDSLSGRVSIKNSFPCTNCMWYFQKFGYKENKVFK